MSKRMAKCVFCGKPVNGEHGLSSLLAGDGISSLSDYDLSEAIIVCKEISELGDKLEKEQTLRIIETLRAELATLRDQENTLRTRLATSKNDLMHLQDIHSRLEEEHEVVASNRRRKAMELDSFEHEHK